MTAFVPSTPAELARAADLRRVKTTANLVLLGSLALLAVARMLEPRHPAFGFVAAFAEAAAIGGLADWYAVVALFRRPLGLPIPHTAIILNNQQRIADKLGEFVERNFLDDAPVEKKLREVDFGAFVAEWLSDRKRSADLARFILRMLPEALTAIETSGLNTALLRRVTAQLDKVDLAPVAADTLRNFVQEQRHRGLLDELLVALHEMMEKPETLAAIRTRIRDELPTLLRLYRADSYLMKKIAASAIAFFDDVRTQPDHPFRGEFDRLIVSFIDRLESQPQFAERLNLLKRDILARPEIALFVHQLWGSLRDYVARSAAGESSVLQNHLARMLNEAGHQLAADAELRGEINNGLVAVLRTFVAEQKSGVSGFIADQVKGWDMTQLVGLIELNVGRDLQYIRFNGALVGGLAGLALHTVEILLRMV